jgi:hypothetical protein
MSDPLQMDPVQAMLAQTSLQRTLFDATSRYYGIDPATLDLAGADPVIYLRRRLVPAPQRFQLLQEHTVTQGERLDHLAAQYLGDPRLFWRLCDANNAMLPDELTATVGRKLRVTLPDGISGVPL